MDLLPCVRAALNQEYDGTFELIVIDDGTRNESISLLETMPATIIRKDRPRGWPDSVAIAAHKAQHDTLAFTDSDCIVPKNWLHMMSNCLEGRGIVTGNLDHGNAFSERFSHIFTHFHFASDKPHVVEFLNDGNFGIRRELLNRCLVSFPAVAGMGGGAGAVVLSAIVRDMGIAVLLDPRIEVRHKSEDFLESLRLWFSKYGPNTLGIRRFNPEAKGAGLLKLGFLAPLVFGAGRLLSDMSRFARSWKRFGFHRHELPLCVVWYSACAAAYLLGMLNYMKDVRKNETRRPV
ncbi:MAG: glycosyltransferase family 2 protein [Deltaproteobacteria bacterium]|nr:glycosyltransferase family 2 protein [Deltaproteobacteria bacterium]MBW1816579.1 glycosyltransferase family 2 protein [Deltaproteobacteria bacterium]MBW2283617.1 glycosyltransferase family 2 protein [Deltaproteobacteria bacterium]